MKRIKTEDKLELHWGSHIDNNLTRAYKLSNGDVFSLDLKGLTLMFEFEDNILYEVVEGEKIYSIYGHCMHTEYDRTDISYTVEEINEMMKERGNVKDL